MTCEVVLQGTSESCRYPQSGLRHRRAPVSLAIFFWKLLVLLALPGLLAGSPACAQLSTRSMAMQITAAVQESPPQITLNWPPNALAGVINIYKRPLASYADFLNGWTPMTVLPAGSTSYIDTSVVPGVLYEYFAYAYVAGSNDPCFGYITTGFRIPVNESRGKVLLVVESTYAQDLKTELARLQQDLTGDGWMVIRHDVSQTDTPDSIKALIQADYNADPANVHSVFLFGKIPVPYAGPVAPDGHPDHLGPWPSDAYYGTMHGQWTPVAATAQWGPYFANTSLPANADLEVGRVDLSNMPIFAPKSEGDLLRQYLDKDHNFRHGVTSAQRRGLITDHFGYAPFLGSSDFAVSGYDTMAALFGVGNIFDTLWTPPVNNFDYDQTFPTLQKSSYLWTYICSGGMVNSFAGVYYTGLAVDYAARDPKTVFMMSFGSTFGNWNQQDDFLRAPLGDATWSLTNLWSGNPRHFDHRTAMGLTMGDSVRLNQNTGHETYTALMGDPTLRVSPVAPISGLFTQASPGKVILNWVASPDTVLGYCVYRASSPTGPFTRLNSSLISPTTYTDNAPQTGVNVYMVRAIKLEATASGTYYNASQGIFQTITLSGSAPSISLTAPDNNSVIRTPQGTPASITLSAQAGSTTTGIKKVEFFANGNKVGETATPGAAGFAFTWNNAAEGAYAITAVATDNNGSQTAAQPVTISVRSLYPPQIGITLTSGALQLPGGSFSISAAAVTKTPNDQIERVQLLANGTQVAELKTADLPYYWGDSYNATMADQPLPYLLNWSNVPAGNYQLTAKAITNKGMWAISAPISVSVTNTIPAPTISITSPANGDSEMAGVSIPVLVKASTPVSNASITKVDLYVNGAKVASSAAAPFTTNWQPAQPGAYTLTATATDNVGTAGTSTPVTVNVVAVGNTRRINAGGPTVGIFFADAFYSGGSAYTSATPVDISGVTNPAPMSVYQSCRSGTAFNYAFPNLTAGGSYKVRLHFAEPDPNRAGTRFTNVAINGTSVLSNFDPATAAGGSFKAIVKEFVGNADANGSIAINFSSPSSYPLVCAVEVLPYTPQIPAAPTGLTAVPGNTQVTLNWNTVSNATSYNLYRATSAGAETLYKTGLTTANYTDTGLTNGTTYFYKVSAVNSVGESGQSSEASAALVNSTILYRINAGGGSVSSFAADNFYSGGNFWSTTAAIDTSGATNPAPMSVYQSCRTGTAFSYAFPGLTANGSYKVRLHFVEPDPNRAGTRFTYVAINGTSVLSNFDPATAAGGSFKAIVKEFSVTADANGALNISFTSPKSYPCVCAIEVIAH